MATSTEGNIELEEMGINFDTEAYNSAEDEYIRQSRNYLNNNSSLVYRDNSVLEITEMTSTPALLYMELSTLLPLNLQNIMRNLKMQQKETGRSTSLKR